MEDTHICGRCNQKFKELDNFLAHKRMACIQTNVPKTVDKVTIYTIENAVSTSQQSVFQNLSKDHQFNACGSISQEENDIGSDNESLLQINTNKLITSQPERIPQVITHRGSNEKTTSKQSVITVVCSSNNLPNINNDNISFKIKKPKYIKCPEQGCDFSARYKKDLLRHTRKHTGDRPYCCTICPRTFSRSDKLTLHIRSHKGDKPYKCNDCPYTAVDRGSLTKHLRIHSNERPYKCQICDYASRNSSQLVVHLRTHTGDTPFHCQNCNAKFKINSDLNRHMRVHTKEKPYVCLLCNYRCSMKGNLNVHMKNNHLREKKHVCEDCGTSFCTKHQLKTHMAVHISYKPFKCLDCDYRCKDKTSFKRHERAHSEDRPYKCDLCDFKAKYVSHKQRHMKKAHAEEWTLKKEKRKEDKLKLKESEYIGLIRGKCATLSLHASTKKKLTCTHCDASFVRKDSLNSHLRQHIRMEETLQSTALAVLQLQEAPVMIVNEEQSDLIDVIPGESPEVTSVRFSVSRGSQEINQILQSVDKGLSTTLLTNKDLIATTGNDKSTQLTIESQQENSIVRDFSNSTALPTQDNIVQMQGTDTFQQVMITSQQQNPAVIGQVQSPNVQSHMFQIQANALGGVLKTNTQPSISPVALNVSTDQNVTLHIVDSGSGNSKPRNKNLNMHKGSEKHLIPLQQKVVASLSHTLHPTVIQAPLTVQNLRHCSYQNLQFSTSPQRFQLVPVSSQVSRKVRPIASKPMSTAVNHMLADIAPSVSRPTSTTDHNQGTCISSSHFQLGEASTMMQKIVEQTRKQKSNKQLVITMQGDTTQLTRNPQIKTSSLNLAPFPPQLSHSSVFHSSNL